MKAYWNSLNERERWMVIAAGLCLFIYGYYLVLYAPLAHRVEERSFQLADKVKTLSWMKTVTPQKTSSSTQKKVNNSQLLAAVATRLKDNANLNQPYELQQTRSGEIQLSFEEVPFNTLMKWLIQMNQSYAFTIKQLDLNATATPGIVKAIMIITANN